MGTLAGDAIHFGDGGIRPAILLAKLQYSFVSLVEVGVFRSSSFCHGECSIVDVVLNVKKLVSRSDSEILLDTEHDIVYTVFVN